MAYPYRLLLVCRMWFSRARAEYTLMQCSGLGYLDAEVLELSVRTLSDMADGNRIIGIFSRVTEPRERIDKQIRMEKTHKGSKIRLVV